MARGTGTNRAMSEVDISKLIRGDKKALAKQAATGGNTKPTSAPAPQAPTNPAPSPTSPTATPAQNPANPSAAPAAGAAPARAAAPSATPPTPPPLPNKARAEEEKEEPKVVTRGLNISGYSNPFMAGGAGYTNEGSDAALTMESKIEALKRKGRAIAARGGSPPVPPAPPSK